MKVIRTNLTTSFFAVRMHVYKFLCMLNIISFKELAEVFKYIETNPHIQPYSYRKVNPEYMAHIANAKKIFSTFAENPKSWSNIQQNQLAYPVSTDSASYRATVVTPIEIYKVDPSIKNLTSGGFGKISLLKVHYKIKGSDKMVSRQIIIKEERSDDTNDTKDSESGDHSKEVSHRMQNEHLVLNHFQLKKSTSPYIAKFFHASRDNKQKVGLNRKGILMEFYPHKSLEHFKRKMTDTISVNTKLWFLTQMANGIRYMKQEGVYHLDLKNSNILIQKNYSLKLIDFGESYIKSVDPALGVDSSKYIKSFKPGRTMPFAAPELLTKPFDVLNLHDKTDVFSFGMIMGEMLFENFLVDFKKSNLSALCQKYREKNYQTRFSQESAEAMGPKKIFKYLRILTILCLDSEPERRPTHEWIVIALRELSTFLEKLY
eukprot:CAMPEP_0176438752 /NCGR_PEP_ID=MMETSP0127-20121128/19501_1 /TAXON_ID=938130 /ORGANISM="Platyophrya macrostoma, Strain WH" /LENGTH=430 /DNA_ID=CAMNT_0017822823 /DNA_START=439 /DNA_END=1732 /DNA_ORIENTATION=-